MKLKKKVTKIDRILDFQSFLTACRHILQQHKCLFNKMSGFFPSGIKCKPHEQNDPF